MANEFRVSMPSRANASLLLVTPEDMPMVVTTCQCPLGLMPHCYSRGEMIPMDLFVVSMPSRANASLLPYLITPDGGNWVSVSMPSRANASLLR